MKAVFAPNPEKTFLGIDIKRFDIGYRESSTPVKEITEQDYRKILEKTCPQDIEVGLDGADFEYRGHLPTDLGGYAVYTKGIFGLILIDPDKVKAPPPGFYDKRKFCKRFLNIYLK